MWLVRSKGLWVLLAVFSAVSLYVGKVLATPPSGLATTILAKSLFDEIDVRAHSCSADWKARLKTEGLSDVYVVDNVLAPGGSTGWHSHPGPSLINVVSGTVTNYSGDDPKCAGQTYGAGQGFIDSGSDVHILRNQGTEPAHTIAVQILPKDAVRRIDMAAPGNCSF